MSQAYSFVLVVGLHIGQEDVRAFLLAAQRRHGARVARADDQHVAVLGIGDVADHGRVAQTHAGLFSMKSAGLMPSCSQPPPADSTPSPLRAMYSSGVVGAFALAFWRG